MQPLQNDRLIRALLRQPVDVTPVWMMRQAGRYLPEYLRVRKQAGSFMALCTNPELACEVTLQPLERFPLDAAILFSDILVVPDALGLGVTFVEGEGPKLQTIRDGASVARLTAGSLHEHLAPVYETIRRLRENLPAETALIGFAGAPWTVTSYMVEGGGSKEFQEARTFARRDPEAFSALIDLVTKATIDYLLAQVKAGAQALQLFDSWAGVLPPDQFHRWCERPMGEIVRAVKDVHPEIPIIAFPRGAGILYEQFVERVPVDGVSLDTTVPPAWANRALKNVCLQGNLDPIVLCANQATIKRQSTQLLDSIAGRNGHIFNLGHGIIPETPVDNVKYLVDLVHEYSSR